MYNLPDPRSSSLTQKHELCRWFSSTGHYAGYLAFLDAAECFERVRSDPDEEARAFYATWGSQAVSRCLCYLREVKVEGERLLPAHFRPSTLRSVSVTMHAYFARQPAAFAWHRLRFPEFKLEVDT